MFEKIKEIDKRMDSKKRQKIREQIAIEKRKRAILHEQRKLDKLREERRPYTVAGKFVTGARTIASGLQQASKNYQVESSRSKKARNNPFEDFFK